MNEQNKTKKEISFSERYLNLVENAIEEITNSVKSQGGRIILFHPDEVWDDENSLIRPEVYEKSLILNLNNGNHLVEMCPIDLLDNNGSVRVAFIDEYGDKVGMYTEDMEDFAVCLLSDFITNFKEIKI